MRIVHQGQGKWSLGYSKVTVIKKIKKQLIIVFLPIVTVAFMILPVWCIATLARSGSAMDVATPLAGRQIKSKVVFSSFFFSVNFFFFSPHNLGIIQRSGIVLLYEPPVRFAFLYVILVVKPTGRLWSVCGRGKTF